MRTAAGTAKHIRDLLKEGGSAEHAAGVQWFFKEEVHAHGWYTADLRRFAAKQRREILAEGGFELLLDASDRLFSGEYLEERSIAIELVKKDAAKFGDKEFRRFEKWLGRVISWADHDALVYYLLGSMVVADKRRLRSVDRWAKSKHRWFRRASAVALIPGVRKKLYFDQIEKLWGSLKDESDDMVLKGIGWVLREAAKADPKAILPFLMRIRGAAPRLVLRTACETLPPKTRAKVLG